MLIPASKLNKLSANQIISTVLLSVALILTMLATTTHAQVLYGTITGNVTDPSGAAVPNAKVEALDELKGVTQETTTNESGIYRFADLQPGRYKVTVSTPNFSPLVTEHIVVEANTVHRQDAQLSVAGQQQTVTVTAEAPELQADKGDVHTDLTANEIYQSADHLFGRGSKFPIPASGSTGIRFAGGTKFSCRQSSTRHDNQCQRAIFAGNQYAN